MESVGQILTVVARKNRFTKDLHPKRRTVTVTYVHDARGFFASWNGTELYYPFYQWEVECK